MNRKHWFGLSVVLMVLTGPAVMAEDPPMPMPRPADRMPEGASEATPLQLDGPATANAALPLASTSVPESNPALAAVEAVAAVPQPVTLVARITDGGAQIPDGVVWRVFETRTDATGELALAAKSNDAMARLQLNPGQYVVHVAYGRAQTTDTMTVAEGDNAKQLVLDAGAMRLNAAVSGDIAIPINLLRFDVFTAGAESDRDVVAEGLSPNDIVTLNAGTYHVVSRFGEVNAVVRADLRVEPGQLTEATLYHRAAQVSFKLVSQPGGEAIADIDWKVTTADGQTVFTNIGAFPTTVLAEGDYVVAARRGDQSYNREFQVQPGPSREVEVLTAVY